jgi:FKBP-type peptidyl-prolyl cis-trans isomerase SlyD
VAWAGRRHRRFAGLGSAPPLCCAPVNIAAHKVVSIEYTLTSDAGEVIDTSVGRDPLVYLHGARNIVPGLENALEGKGKGEMIEVSVPPAEGYGLRDDRLVRNIPMRKLSDGKLQVGQQLRAETGHVLTVRAIKGDYATVDANHPLASQTLHFKVKVLDVRDATAQELEHGHVHGPHGHDH